MPQAYQTAAKHRLNNSLAPDEVNVATAARILVDEKNAVVAQALNGALVDGSGRAIVSLQAETTDYVGRIAATGGYLDGKSAALVDEFVVTAKRESWWTDLREVSPFAGSNLAAAMVKLKYVTASAWTQEASGWTESNYSPSLGINAGTGNATRSLASGYNPSTDGLTYQTISFGSVLTSSKVTFYGYPFALDATGGTTNIILGDGGNAFVWGNDTAVGANYPIQASTRIFTGGAATKLGYINGVQHYNGAIGSSVTLDGTFKAFTRYAFGTTRYYGDYDLGFAFVGSALTAAKCVQIDAAIQRLLYGLGRLWRNRKPNAYFLGDSITFGDGASVTANKFATLTAAQQGWNELNCGVQSDQLRASSTTDKPGGVNRYVDIVSHAPEVCVIDYGTNDAQVADGTSNGDGTIASDFETKFETIITGLKAVGTRVIVSGIGYLTTPNSTKLGLYAAKCALAAKNTGAAFADCYRYMLDQTALGVTQTDDGTHPNDAGHATKARAINDALQGRARRIVALDFPSIAAGASADLTVTILNAVTGLGQSATVDIPTGIDSGLVFSAFVSAADTVTVRATNATSGAINASSATFIVTLRL